MEINDCNATNSKTELEIFIVAHQIKMQMNADDFVARRDTVIRQLKT
jgi:hypothetical protein